MEVISDIQAMRSWTRAQKNTGQRVALVPTMGFLHEGHLSLIHAAKQHAEKVIVSIFVNPTQFGPGEDYESYFRDLDTDSAKCKAEGVDAIFHPAPDSMYLPDASAYVNEELLSLGMCGRARPGDHFKGVLTIVTKLFNICEPDLAVFGEKDGQQLRLIKRMVRDLDMPVEIINGPTLREADGLAMSSRNAYLSDEERKQALCLKQSLDLACDLVKQGESNCQILLKAIHDHIGKFDHAEIDYVEIVDDESLQPIERIESPAMLALAVKVGKARLIDNCLLTL